MLVWPDTRCFILFVILFLFPKLKNEKFTITVISWEILGLQEKVCSTGEHKLQTANTKATAEVICVYSAFGISDIFMEEVDSA